jgi:hypothetical protein
MAAARTSRASWPSGPSGYYQDEVAVQDQTAPNRLLSEQREAMGVISELAILLRDTRFYLSISAGTLAAITLGVALEAAFSGWAVRRGAALGIVNFALLCGLLACWLRALLLLVTSGRPVVNTLSELRWRTGAPLDTRAPWLTLPPVGSNPEEWTWIRAHLLVGAARLTRHRLQRADTWTYVTAGAFLIWTAFLLLGL